MNPNTTAPTYVNVEAWFETASRVRKQLGPLVMQEWFRGRYQIEELLGMGTTAAAFLATDTAICRPVVLKIPFPDTDPRFCSVAHEARVLGRLNHPHIVRLFDVGYGNNEIPDFISLEYLGRTTLRAHAKGCPLPKEVFENVALQLSGIIEFLHDSADLYQIDLKPDNLAFDSGNRKITMMDFGSLLVLDSGRRTTLRYGTPGYLAPELLTNPELTSASDIFSFGVVLFELITGIRPFLEIQRPYSSDAQRGTDREPISTAIELPLTACIDIRSPDEDDDCATTCIDTRLYTQSFRKQATRTVAEMERFEVRSPLERANVNSRLADLVCAMMAIAPSLRPTANAVKVELVQIAQLDRSTRRAKVFISHAHADKERFVNAFVSSLKRRGFEVWVDNQNLRAGESFWEKIGAAIGGCEFVVVVLSRNSVASMGVAEEMRMAQLLNLESVKILPIRIDPISFDAIPLFLRARHVLDFVGWEESPKLRQKLAKLTADMNALLDEKMLKESASSKA